MTGWSREDGRRGVEGVSQEKGRRRENWTEITHERYKSMRL